MTPSEEKTAEERAREPLLSMNEIRAEAHRRYRDSVTGRLRSVEAAIFIKGALWSEQRLRLTNQRLEAEVERMKTELIYTKDSMIRIAREFGIEVPEQLFALAENNEETLADILIRHIQSHLRDLESQKGQL